MNGYSLTGPISFMLVSYVHTCMYMYFHNRMAPLLTQTRESLVEFSSRGGGGGGGGGLYALDRVSSSALPHPLHALCNITLGVCMNNKSYLALCYMTDNLLSVT